MSRPDVMLSVLLRLPDHSGCACCVLVSPEAGRPDVRPERPWTEMGGGDEVLVDEETVYVVDRIVPLEAPVVTDPAAAEARRREGRETLIALAGAR